MLKHLRLLGLLTALLLALASLSPPATLLAAPAEQLPPPRGPLPPSPLVQVPPPGGLPVQAPPALPPPQGMPQPGLPLGPAPQGPPMREPLLQAPLVRDPAQRAPVSQDPVAQALVPLREAYVLLLDQYVDPLLPGNLINAAQQGITTALAEQGITAPDPTSYGAQPPVVERQSNWQWLTTRFRALASQHSDRVAPRDLAYAAITAMANSTDDSHTQFMAPKDYDEHRSWTRGEMRYAGTGMRLRGPDPTVAQVFPDSPAAAAGIQVGDTIVAIDDQPVAGLKIDEIVQRVRGPEGSTVRLRVRRAATGQEQDISIVRAQVNLPFVESRVEGDLGYIALRGFPEPSVVDAVERALTTLQSQGVRGLVFDLRGNSGGRLDVGTRLLSRFVGDGVVYQMVDRHGRGETQRLRGTAPVLNVPLVVLIDEGTASMGELFAATIQERGVGRLIGTTTAGSVSASVVIPLSDGSALQMTVERILTGNGRTLDKVGVNPDQPVPLSIADIQAGRDPQLDAAMLYLRANATTTAHHPLPATR